MTYLAWDFEARPVAELPRALADAGHDAARPTLTIWEGVTMYLTEGAIADSVAAVHAYSAPGSPFVATYFDRTRLDHPSPVRALVSKLVARGEPFRFGWYPTELPGWFAQRGFELAWDRDTVELAQSLLLVTHARTMRERGSRIALLRRAP